MTAIDEKHKRRRGGTHCIAPGCNNEYYNTQGVHYHILPQKRKTVYNAWLSALKRANPPVGVGFCVCSDHVLNSDYVFEYQFNELGSFVQTKKAKLKPEAVPSIFDFSSYCVETTDRPTKSANKPQPGERANRRASMAGEREVGYPDGFQRSHSAAILSGIFQERLCAKPFSCAVSKLGLSKQARHVYIRVLPQIRRSSVAGSTAN